MNTLRPRAIATRLGTRTFLCTSATHHDIRAIARYCRMRGLLPWTISRHLEDERLALLILRVAIRRHHPRVKIPDLLRSFLAAGVTAAEWLNNQESRHGR